MADHWEPRLGSNPLPAIFLVGDLFRMRPDLRDRDLELRIKGHLYEIQQVNDDQLESRQGYPMAEMGYQTTLLNVADCADADAVDEVAQYIKDYIQEYDERPANRKVRRKARSVVSQAGYPANRYLNAA